jgi:hypothetical protein
MVVTFSLVINEPGGGGSAWGWILAWIAVAGTVASGFLLRVGAAWLLLGVLLSAPLLVLFGEDQPYSGDGYNSEAAYMYLAMAWAVLILVGIGLRWCFDWLVARYRELYSADGPSRS